MTLTESAPRLAPALDARFYRDPELAELEQERIFSRTWQLVAHVSQLASPGDYLTGTAGVQPVLVLRAEDGRLRAFRNVCRHRGSRLLNGSGQCGQAIRCLYHGWTYRLDGAADRRARGTLDRRSRQGRAGAVPGPRRDAVRARLREPRHPRAAAGRAGRRAARAARALQHRGAEAERRMAQHPAGELEDRHRQLQRGLPRADRPSRADAAARLQALRRGGPRRLGLVRGADARQAVGEPDGARLPAARVADARPRRGGPARVALRDDLPEHHDRPLSGPGRHLADRSRRAAPLARRAPAPTATRAPGSARGSRSSRTTG